MNRLLALQHSPVVALNRAVAVSHAKGPAAAWPLLQALAQEPRLRDYPTRPARSRPTCWSAWAT